MPCYDEGNSPQCYENPETKRRLDVATRVACEAFQSLSTTLIRQMSPEAQRWWTNHQEADRRRIEKEKAQERADQLRKAARAKLSPEERKALGIK